MLTEKGAFDKLGATEWNELIRSVRPIAAIKAADQTAPSTTLVSDAHLNTPLTMQNTAYRVMLWLKVTSTVNFKIEPTLPLGCSGFWTIRNQAIGGAAGTVYQGLLDWYSGQAQAVITGDFFVKIEGVLQLGSTVGTLGWDWAPNSAGSAIVRTGSTVVLEPVQ